MNKNWLRGLLLGVSMAVVLSGGVALAQDLFLKADKDCVECWPGRGAPTEDRYLLPYTMGGWDPSYELCPRVTVDGELLFPESCAMYPPGPLDFLDSFPCEWDDRDSVPALVLGGEASVANGKPGPLGEWKYEIRQEIPGAPISSAEITFLVAEVCEVEFVPEPGSILLLGSGLAGLAGYAALRWRTRQ